MKKELSQFAVLLSILSLVLMLISCLKSDTTTQSSRRLIPIRSEDKTVNQYLMVICLGHDASTCSGCVMINGKMYHIDCQGAGDVCRKSSIISLTSTGTSLSAETIDTFGLTNLDFLNMPSQSLSLEVDEGVYSYLNIPAQLVFRDEDTQQFTFTGLSFSESPLYSNN